MRIKAASMVLAAVPLVLAGIVTMPAPALAGDTWGYKNCTLESSTEQSGSIRCYVGSWRAQAKVDCYKYGTSTNTPKYGTMVDTGVSTATCPSGYERGAIYAHYNQSTTVKLG